MEIQDKSHFALLRVEGDFILPTELLKFRALEVNAPLSYDAFAIGSRIEQIDSKSYKTEPGVTIKTFRNFKTDLRLNISQLKLVLLKARSNADAETIKTTEAENDRRKNALKWSMKSLKGKKEMMPKVEMVAETPTTRIFFNPLDAAQVFLSKVVASINHSLYKHFPDHDCKLKIHVTIPAYDTTEASENYRNNLQKTFEEVESRGIDFELFIKGQGDFLYEPYGVFYYYAAFEGLVNFPEAKGHTYLIFDMGGSTTDLAIVQVSLVGKHSRVYPMAQSIDSAGADFDEFLLDSILGDITLQNSEERDKALREVERAKIELCKEPNEAATLKFGEKYIDLKYKKLTTIVKDWWNRKENPLRTEIGAFLQRAKEASKSNPQFLEFSAFEKVFLAGGSVALPGLLDLLASLLSGYSGDRKWEDLFVWPQRADATCVTSIGLAYEVSLRSGSPAKDNKVQRSPIGLMSRADRVYCKIFTDQGDHLAFTHNKVVSPSPNEILIYAKDRKHADKAFQYGTYSELVIDPVKLSNGLRFRLRTDFQSEIEADNVGERILVPLDSMKLAKETSHNIPITLSHESPTLKENIDSGNLEITMKPFLHRINPNGAPNTRLDEHGKGALKAVLTPPEIIDSGHTIHACIDFGMSNTCVTLYSPTLYFENSSDIKVISIVNSGPQTDESEEVSIAEPTVEVAPTDQLIQPASVATEPPHEADISFPNINNVLLESLDRLGHSVNKVAELLNALNRNEGLAISQSVRSTKDTHRDIFESVDPRIRSREEANSIIVNEKPVDYSTDEFGYEWFKQFVEGEGFIYAEKTLRMVYAQAMNPNAKLIVLAGPPGTGKTSLVGLLARFFDDVDSRSQNGRASFHKVIPISPTWFSPSSLLGGYSEIDGKLKVTPFLEFALLANYIFQEINDHERARKFFVCLDEFNLAHPEQYLSSVLSSMEIEYRTPGSEIWICSKDIFDQEAGSNLTVGIPPNLKLFATVNTDSTSKILSPKVLDRCTHVKIIPQIEELTVFLQKIRITAIAEVPALNSLFEVLLPSNNKLGLFVSLFELAQMAQSPIGYRLIVRLKEIISQHPFTIEMKLKKLPEMPVAKVRDLLDEVVCSIFLSRLPGVFSLHGKEYADRLELELQNTAPNALQTLPGVKAVLKGLLSGYSGQTAF